MREGDWVYGTVGRSPMLGYVLAVGEISTYIECTVPIDMRIMAKNDTFLPCSDDSIHIDDIPALIDLALMTGDKEWFGKLQIEVEWWKKSGELLSKK